jgi:hypothetical protein
MSGFSLGSIPLIKLKSLNERNLYSLITSCNILAGNVITNYTNNISSVGGGITQEAINANYNFVLNLCNAGLWDKFAEIGTFSGNSLTSSLIKLKYQSQPSLISYNYVEGNYLESIGLESGAVNSYIDTSVSLNTIDNLSSLNMHLSIYVMNDVPTNVSNRSYIGVNQGSSRAYIIQRNVDNAISKVEGIVLNNDCASVYNNPPFSKGLWTVNNTSDFYNRLYLNQNKVGEDFIQPEWRNLELPDLSVFLNAIHNSDNNPTAFGETTIGFYSIGEGFNLNEQVEFYNIFSTFLTEVGRTIV